MLLGDVAGAADQLQVGDELLGRVGEERVGPLGLEQIVAELIAVAGERALHPCDPPHRAVIARERGEHRTVVGQPPLALDRVKQRERAAPNPQRGRERPRTRVLDGTEARALILPPAPPRETLGPSSSPGSDHGSPGRCGSSPPVGSATMCPSCARWDSKSRARAVAGEQEPDRQRRPLLQGVTTHRHQQHTRGDAQGALLRARARRAHPGAARRAPAHRRGRTPAAAGGAARAGTRPRGAARSGSSRSPTPLPLLPTLVMLARTRWRGDTRKRCRTRRSAAPRARDRRCVRRVGRGQERRRRTARAAPAR